MALGAIVGLPMAIHAQTATVTVLYNFNGGTGVDGANPQTELIQGSDGNLYGTTSAGGGNQSGTAFQITPAGAFKTLTSFTDKLPSGLVQGKDGNFYGTTQGGGSGSKGTVFRLSPGGAVTTLVRFTGANGASPSAGLIQGKDGNFYGTTREGGSNSLGTVFRMSAAGALTTLIQFSTASDTYPEGALVQDRTGNFYGTTTEGGSAGLGTVFEIPATGVAAPLFNFTDYSGDHPVAPLLVGIDGHLYGTASRGGQPGGTGYGTAFWVAPGTGSSGSDNFLSNTTNGAYPFSGLVQAADGTFYGTTSEGGRFNQGTIFRFTPTGTLTTLASLDGTNGGHPKAGLVMGQDGILYGTASTGGKSDGSGIGTVFRVELGYPAFFAGEAALGSNTFFLRFPGGNPFGYYSFLSDAHYVYHFDLGYEYVFDANDGKSGVYLYDFASSTFFYTSPSFPFPYLYDFTLRSTVYYYPNPNDVDRYNTNGTRYFYVFSTGKIISK